MRYLFAVCLVLLGAEASATVMPVGIPSPDWDIDATVLSEHGDDDYATHWIDSTSGSCTDTSNPAGTEATPRCTIPSLAALSPGDVVRICGGPYTGSTISVAGDGSSTDPIFIRGCSNESRTEMRRGFRISTAADYIYFEHFSFTTLNEALITATPSTNVIINRIVIRDNDGTGLGTANGGSAMTCANDSFDDSVSHCVFLRNTLHDFGDWTAASENDLHCFTAGSRTTHMWFLYNTAYHCSGDGVQVGHTGLGRNYVNHIFIGGNTFYANGENGIDIKQIHDFVISSNEIYGPHGTIDSNQCMVLHYGNTSGLGPYGGWILNNYLHDCRVGIATSGNLDTEPLCFIGNLFANLADNASDGGGVVAIAHSNTGGGAHRIYHNTFVNITDAGGGTAIVQTSSLTTLALGGNIVSNVTTRHLNVGSVGNIPTATAATELYYQGGGNIEVIWRGSTYTSASAWDSAVADVTGALQADPLFTGASDFTLQASSPAINAGVDMSSIETEFQTYFGTSLLFDIDGNARPNGVWDIGAYEYTEQAPAGTRPPFLIRPGD